MATQPATTQPAKGPPPKAPSRMTLASVKRGKLDKPLRVLVYGVEKIGKSSFAAGAPDPVFVCPEGGTEQLDVARFPEPHIWDDVLDGVEALRKEDHAHKTVVFDTLDWLEPLLWTSICERDGHKNVEDYGYGKGYTAALDEWRRFVSRLEQLRAERGMAVVLLAHSWIKPFKNPEGPDYDRHELKTNNKAAGFLKEWCDAVLFANFETLTHEDKKKRTRGISTGARVVYTQRTAAYDAGNRLGLPPELALDWGAFAEAIASGTSSATVMARIGEMLEGAEPGYRAKVEASIAAAPNDVERLARIMNKIATDLSTKENAQ